MARIQLQRTPAQLELVRAMVSADINVANEAKIAFASFVSDVIKKTFTQAVNISNLYELIPVTENEPQTLPLDPFDDLTQENFFNVTMQQSAGGMPSNMDYGVEEIPFMTYTLASAISYGKRHLKAARLDVVAKGIQHLADELNRKREDNSMAPILYNVYNASTTGFGGVNYPNVFCADSAGTLYLNDFVNLMVRASRLRQSSVGGTAGNTNWLRGITDLVISPEKIGDLRRVAFNPMNTKQAVGGTTSIPAPQSVREEVFNNAGIPSFYDINIIPIYEMGVSQRYSALFSSYAGSTSYNNFTGATVGSFTNGTNEFALGIDRTVGHLKKPIIIENDANNEIVSMPDDQYSTRQKKVGFYSELQESALVTDSRGSLLLII